METEGRMRPVSRNRLKELRQMKKVHFSVSAPTLNLLRLESEIALLREAGVDEFYVPVADGIFSPVVGGDIALVHALKTMEAACHVHLMTSQPERHVMQYIDAGADAVTVHAEACIHLHRTLTQIRDTGADVGVALKPSTPLTALEYVLDMADRALLLVSDPGSGACAAIDNSVDRVRILEENIKLRGLKVRIEIVGAFDVADAARYTRFGAHALVLPRPLFAEPNQDPGEGIRDFLEMLALQRELV